MVTIALALSMLVGSAVSAPSQTQGDTFERPDASRWDLVRGDLSFGNEQGVHNDTLTWMILGDDDDSLGTGPSRVRANATHVTDGNLTWNTTSGSYYYSATIENHESYLSPSASTNTTFTGAGPASTTTAGTGDNATGGQVIDDGVIPLTISATQTEGIAPLSTTFGFDSTHANATNLSWAFDADGDAPTDANGTGFPAAASFVYTTPGTYWARIQTWEGNDTGDAWLEIVVKREILASFGVDESAPAAGMGITFTANSTEADAATLTWSMDLDGDGIADASGSGLPASVGHTYAGSGLYNATLTVSDGIYTSTATLSLTVDDAIAPTPPSIGPSLDGALGITFGETDGGGYYVAAFTNDRFFLGIPNATSGDFDILVDLPDWGGVDPRKQDIDIRHRYSIEVDGTTVVVKVDNGKVGSYALPGVPRGNFGIIADEDMRVNVGEVYWQTLDRIQPSVEIWRPESGSIYVHDHGFTFAAGSGLPTIVEGPLTVVIDIADDPGGVGLKSATVMIDGKVAGFTKSPGLDTQMEIQTGHLSPGFHRISVRAFDLQGNMGTDSVDIFVLSAKVPTSNTVGSVEKVVEDALGNVPPL